MIDFNTSQLTWIVVGACSFGGGGYLTMNEKIENLDKKVSVSINTMDHTAKTIDQLSTQLTRFEEKIDKLKSK
jgi:hypothetical protein